MKFLVKFNEHWYRSHSDTISGGNRKLDRDDVLKNRTKKDTYMFSGIYQDDKGNLKGKCKFCNDDTEVDIADHSNVCKNIPKN